MSRESARRGESSSWRETSTHTRRVTLELDGIQAIPAFFSTSTKNRACVWATRSQRNGFRLRYYVEAHAYFDGLCSVRFAAHSTFTLILRINTFIYDSSVYTRSKSAQSVVASKEGVQSHSVSQPPCNTTSRRTRGSNSLESLERSIDAMTFSSRGHRCVWMASTHSWMRVSVPATREAIRTVAPDQLACTRLCGGDHTLTSHIHRRRHAQGHARAMISTHSMVAMVFVVQPC